MLLLISLIVAGALTYPFMAGITYRLAQRRRFDDDNAIAAGIFWPFALPSLLACHIYDRGLDRRDERKRQLKEQAELARRELELAEKLLDD